MNIDSVFNDSGELSKVLRGYSPRNNQIEMAKVIEKAIQQKQSVLIEAGTGIGKTLAYLIPAILADKKVIISTGTKNLQDQLYEKDIPALKKFLPVKASLLKGRANYLCLYRLDQAKQTGEFIDRKTVTDLQSVVAWSLHTKTGDKAEVAQVTEDSGVWPYVTSTTENCLNQECPFYNDCFLVKARRQAMQSNLVVVNHHLFFADFSLKEEGFGELLPKTEVVIFDEAHQIPEIASTFFSASFSSKQLVDLAQDVEMERLQHANELKNLAALPGRLEQGIMTMRLAFDLRAEKAVWLPRLQSKAMQVAVKRLQEDLQQLIDLLQGVADRSEGLARCHERAKELLASFNQMIELRHTDQIYWYETFAKSFRLYRTPMTIAEQFQTIMTEQPCSWVFTSATLTMNDRFDHFQVQLNLKDIDCYQFQSPFDYEHHALMYFPRHLVMPNKDNHTPVFVNAVLPFLKQLQGRSFLLFTSYAALEQAAEYLADKIELPLLIQGRAPKQALIQEFQTLGNAILLGTMSFWEGVDVRGQALSAVMIDKLPFLSPGDPVHQARIDYLTQQGEDAFNVYQLPQAVISFKQGIGRLIRGVEDKGIVIIGDPRLFTRNYGKDFLASLPRIPCTREAERVEQFIDSL